MDRQEENNTGKNSAAGAKEQARKEPGLIRIECTKAEQETILKLIDDADNVCIFENKRPKCWGDCKACARHNIQWTIRG